MAGTGVQYYRQRKGLSQTALAGRLRIDGARMSRIESGETIPTAAEIDKLVKLLGIPPSHLFSTHILAEVADRARGRAKVAS